MNRYREISDVFYSLYGSLTTLSNGLSTLPFSSAAAIPPNSDLDSYTAPGIYHCENAATANTLSNCPVTVGFTLFVTKKGSYPEQLILGANDIFLRNRTSSGWYDWISPTANFSNYFPAPSTMTDLTIEGIYGFVTGSGKDAHIFIPLNMKNEARVINITKLRVGLRMSKGGYLGGQDNMDVTSYITQAYVRHRQCIVYVVLSNTDGWGADNNTPIIGRGIITATLSAAT